jgi:hypothetical protein
VTAWRRNPPSRCKVGRSMSAGIRLVPVSLLVTLLVGCGDGTETIETPPTAEATNPVVLFDGTTCRYDGPSRVTAGGLTPIVLENTSDTDIVAGLFRVRNENSLQGASITSRREPAPT